MDGSLSESSCATPVASLDEPSAVRGQRIPRLEGFLLVGLEFGGLDFGDLMAQQFEFAVQRGLVGGEAGVFLAQAGEAAPDGHVLLAGGLGAAVGVEQIELAFGAEQGLVVVRAVQVHEQVAELLEDREGGRRTVDELPVAARRREGAFDDQVALHATFQAVFLEFGVERAAIVHVETRFHGAGVRAGADEALVGAFAQEQFQRAQDDGLARAGLAGDGDEAGGELPFEFLDQGEVFDAQRGERCQHGARV